MSVTQIISANIVFTDYNTGNEISSAIEGQRVGIAVPVKNVSGDYLIVRLHAQLLGDSLINTEKYLGSGATAVWESFFYMPDGDALITLRSYVWSTSGDILDDTETVTLPLEVGGWVLAATKTGAIKPCLVGGWVLAATKTAIIRPPGLPPCQTDTDCPTGYKCVGGKCVKEEVEKEIPWGWIAAGAVGAGGVVLLTGKEKPKKKT